MRPDSTGSIRMNRAGGLTCAGHGRNPRTGRPSLPRPRRDDCWIELSRAEAAIGRRSRLSIGRSLRAGHGSGASPPPASGGATIARSSSIGSTDPWTPRGSIPWTTSSAATAETTSSGSPSTPNTSIAGPSFRPASGEFWRASKSSPCARARCGSPMPGWFPTSRDSGSPPCGANCATGAVLPHVQLVHVSEGAPAWLQKLLMRARMADAFLRFGAASVFTSAEAGNESAACAKLATGFRPWKELGLATRRVGIRIEQTCAPTVPPTRGARQCMTAQHLTPTQNSRRSDGTLSDIHRHLSTEYADMGLSKDSRPAHTAQISEGMRPAGLIPSFSLIGLRSPAPSTREGQGARAALPFLLGLRLAPQPYETTVDACLSPARGLQPPLAFFKTPGRVPRRDAPSAPPRSSALSTRITRGLFIRSFRLPSLSGRTCARVSRALLVTLGS